MAAEWYYAKGDKQIGPVTEAEIRGLAQSGTLSSTDKVWKEGMPDWLPAGDIKELFPSSVRKSPPPLKATLPSSAWDHEDRTAFSSEQLVGLAIAAGLVLSSVLIPVLSFATGTNFWIFAPLFLIAAPLVVFLWVFNGWMIAGRWTPADGVRGWVEFHRGGVFKREDGTVGTYSMSRDKKLIDFTENGSRSESWRILAWGTTTLEVQDSNGRSRSFKKGLTLAEQNANPFRTSRAKHLTGAWQPITEANEWMEFTRDGAIVFSDGSAGKFSVVGEEPNELIEMEMVNGQTRQFKVVSLTPTQLVIAEGNESTTFRRPGKATKRSDQGAAGASVGMADSGGSEGSQGIFGGLFSYFTKWKCPKCGQRAAERTSSKRIGEVQQRVQSRPDRNSPSFQYRQVIVNVYDVLESFHCDSCKHEWEIVEERSSQA